MAGRARPRALVARALVFATAAPLLARLDLERLQRVLEPRRAVPMRDAQAIHAAGREYAAAVDTVLRRARLIVRPGCLTRGITLYALLRRGGADVALCFGVGRTEGSGDRVVGHCWLVLDDEPFLERGDPRASFTGVATVSSSGVA
jgi:hypothetical protein